MVDSSLLQSEIEQLLLSKLTSISSTTKSSALHWIMWNAREKFRQGNLSELLTWLYQARRTTRSHEEIQSILDQCIGLVYEIDPDAIALKLWDHLPEIEAIANKTASLLPLVEVVWKRTRHRDVRFYLGSYREHKWPVRQLNYLLRAEFIAAYKCSKSVHSQLENAVLSVISKGELA